jgi:hypothetical protein
VSIRIQRSRTTVKDLHHRLQQASRHDDARLVRRICLAKGLSAARPRQLGPSLQRRSPPKLTLHQQRHLLELMDAGPLVVGCETACWNAVVLRVPSWRKCGVLYKLLPNLGLTFQKARIVSAHLDTAQRLAWLQFSGRLSFQDIGGQFNSRGPP